MKTSGSPIALGLRAWFAAEVFFGVGAVLTITLSPTETRTNFAWDVQPAVMAAVLGAYYASTALLFVLPLIARRWEMIRVMILPTAIFSSAELITTFLHLDRFSTATLPFYAWLVSYVLPPPIFFGFYVWQQRRSRQLGADASTQPLPADVRTPLLQWGALLTLIAVLLFIFPDGLIAVAPWRMSPLTTRALMSWLIGVGTLMLSMAHENDRTQVLIGVPTLLLVFPTVTIQIARFAGQVEFANLALFAAYAFMLVGFALGVYLARGKWREALR